MLSLENLNTLRQNGVPDHEILSAYGRTSPELAETISQHLGNGRSHTDILNGLMTPMGAAFLQPAGFNGDDGMMTLARPNQQANSMQQAMTDQGFGDAMESFQSISEQASRKKRAEAAQRQEFEDQVGQQAQRVNPIAKPKRPSGA